MRKIKIPHKIKLLELLTESSEVFDGKRYVDVHIATAIAKAYSRRVDAGYRQKIKIYRLEITRLGGDPAGLPPLKDQETIGEEQYEDLEYEKT